MSENKKTAKMNIPMCMACALLCLTLMSVYFISSLYARYTISAACKNAVRVSVFAADVTVNVSDNVPVAPGEISIIPVVVTNVEKNGKVCEVAQSYSLSVRSLEKNIPLTWAIYSDEECSQEVLSAEGQFSPGKEESASYWIKISWPAEANSAAYAYEVEAIEIKAAAVQID